MTDPSNNPVGFIQEYCQKYNKAFPLYIEYKASGPDHSREFTYKCIFEQFETYGSSRQKKNAKSEAARAMVTLLVEKKYFDEFKVYRTDGTSNVISTDYLDEDKLLLQPNSSPRLDLPPKTPDWKNPISALNEYCQKKMLPLPTFMETSTADKSFVCECLFEDFKTYGHGSNKKTAKSQAAFNMCIKLDLNCSESDQLEQNAISELEELCAQNISMSKPEYVDRPSLDNLFVIKCTVNEISCEGKSITKKGAKNQAASQVMEKLSDMGLTLNGQVKSVKKLSFPSPPSSSAKGSGASVVNTSKILHHELQDFNLEASSEEEDDDKGNLLSEPDLVRLETLTLNDEKTEEKSNQTISQVKEEPVESS